MTDSILRRPACLLLPGLLALAACGEGRSEPARVEAAGAVLEARVSPAALRVGENRLEIELRDAAGAPIEDAHVTASVRMHAMGAMSAMGGPTPVEKVGAGRWRADFALEMGGTWQVAIEAHRPDAPPLVAEGALTVGTPGLRLEAVPTAEAPTRSASEAPAPSSAQGEAPASGAAKGRGARSPQGAKGAAQRGEAERSSSGPKASEVHQDAGEAWQVHREEGLEGPPPDPSADHPTSSAPELRLDPSRLRQLGIASTPARREELTATVRAVGRVVLDETTLHDVTVRIGGFVGEVEADALGERVEKGQVLFTLYSPDAFAAQREYLEALRSQAAARGTSAPGRADALARAAARRLELWGFSPGEVAAVARHGAPREYLPIRAPIGGYVVEKEIVAGSPVEMGQRVYRIAPLDRVWLDAEVYEAELGLIEPGQSAEVALPYAPGRRFDAKVAYVYPRLQAERRTARVRLELDNPDLALRPEMYADVFLRRPLGPRLTVPDSAVLRTGDRSFVFLDLGEGRLRPQRVELGLESEGRVEITSGLAEGDRVVSSGTFLVAGESRLRAALEAW